ncbi:hypothetical protein [Pseudoalteromonas gelatinilytica]
MIEAFKLIDRYLCCSGLWVFASNSEYKILRINSSSNHEIAGFGVKANNERSKQLLEGIYTTFYDRSFRHVFDYQDYIKALGNNWRTVRMVEACLPSVIKAAETKGASSLAEHLKNVEIEECGHSKLLENDIISLGLNFNEIPPTEFEKYIERLASKEEIWQFIGVGLALERNANEVDFNLINTLCEEYPQLVNARSFYKIHSFSGEDDMHYESAIAFFSTLDNQSKLLVLRGYEKALEKMQLLF